MAAVCKPFATVVAIATFCSWSTAYAVGRPCDNGAYGFVPDTFDGIQATHLNAVYLLRHTYPGGEEFGTSFLIRSNPPTLLTAAHNVLQNDESGHPLETTSLTVLHPDLGDQGCSVTISAVDPDLDLAVLSAREDCSNLLPKVPPFELNTGESTQPSSACFFGCAAALERLRNGLVSAIMSSPVPVTRDSDRMILRSPINNGDSGGPVFLSDGTVIGVVLDKYGAGLAEVLPLFRAEQFLQNSTAASNGEDVLAQILNGAETDLRVRFNPRECTSNCFSNLDLLAVAKILENAIRNVPDAQLPKLKCLHRAALQRGLLSASSRIEAAFGLIAQKVVGFAPVDLLRDVYAAANDLPAEAGEVKLDLLRLVDSKVLAAVDAELATRPMDLGALLSRGHNEWAPTTGLTAIGFTPIADAGLIETAKLMESAYGTKGSSRYFNDRAAALLLDLLQIRTARAGLGDLDLTKTDVQTQLRTLAAVSSLVAKQHSFKAQSYEALAGTFATGGAHVDAARALASAWQFGNDRDRVLEGYSLYRRLAMMRGEDGSRGLPLSIGSANGISAQAVAKLILSEPSTVLWVSDEPSSGTNEQLEEKSP